MGIENLTVRNVEVFTNHKYEGIVFEWSANIGFGELTLYKEVGTNEWKAETEYMCKDDDKDFLKMILNEWVNKIKV